MDEFAQTREPDNLFEDDFTPIPQSGTQIVEQQNQNVQDERPINSSIPNPSEASVNEKPDANITTRPPSAVRGDRSATGGVNKPKLTESELSARLAAAKLNNARREEAHRLAEADEASFQKREAQASQKRREEGAARRAMEGEREKNRLRKLGAQGGREWDEGKEEQEPNSPRTSQYRRGAHGGVSRQGGRQQDVYDDHGQGNQYHENFGQGSAPRGGRGRGRGDRSRGDRGQGRGMRGRGGYYDNRHAPREPLNPPGPPVLNAESDFPSLPPANPPHRSEKSQPDRQNETRDAPPSSSQPQNSIDATAVDGSAATGSVTAEPKDRPKTVEAFSPVGEKQSWFDQVETQAPRGGW